MNELTTKQIALSESELVQVLQSSLYPGAAVDSVRMVLCYCRASGLDPMQKPAHIVPMWDSKAGKMRDVVMPGIGLYRTQASRSQQMAGISEPEFGPMIDAELGGQQVTYPEWCRVTVQRLMPNGSVAKFTAIEYWIENYAVKGGKEKSAAPNAMWSKRPRGQIAKCAEAQALRKAFPEFGAAPTADEMEGKVIDMGAADVVQPPAPPPPAAPIWPEENFTVQLERWAKAVAAGLKTTDEILALAKSKGELTDEQTARINALKITETEETTTEGNE